MKWCNDLYLGENAKKEKYKVFGRISLERLQSGDNYLITLSDSRDNLLDIMSANYYLQPHFKKKHIKSGICVVGIAKGRQEAFELVRTIVDDVYQATAGVDVKGYFGQKFKK